MAAGCSCLTTDYLLLVAGLLMPAAYCLLAGGWAFVADRWLLMAAGCWLLAPGSWLLAQGSVHYCTVGQLERHPIILEQCQLDCSKDRSKETAPNFINLLTTVRYHGKATRTWHGSIRSIPAHSSGPQKLPKRLPKQSSNLYTSAFLRE